MEKKLSIVFFFDSYICPIKIKNVYLPLHQ